MPRRPPVILWRHISGDLWRLLILTVAVLVTVIAFAAAVKPLADGKLGPAEAIKFMVLAIPPMLAYALPFSAGFAATLAYHRLAQDNELLAAHSGGIGHRSLLAPALVAGCVLFVALASLNEYVIPRFLRSMERLIAQDLTKLMVNSFERGQAVTTDNLMVFADKVVQPNQELRDRLRGQGITDALELHGVVFVELDGEGRVRHEAVVRRAEVYVAPITEEGGAIRRMISILPIDGAGRKQDEQFFSFERIDPIVMELPNAFSDDPKFLTWGELRALRDHPDRMDFIQVRTHDLAHHLAERATTTTIDADLRNTGQVKLRTADGESMLVRGAGIRWNGSEQRWRILPDSATGSVEIEWWRAGADGSPGGGGITRIVPRVARFRTDLGGADRASRELTLRLEVFDARVGSSVTDVGDDPSGGGGSLLETWEKRGLSLAYDPLPELLERDAFELLELAGPSVDRETPDQLLVPPTRDLRRELGKLQREITSKQHERWALASACLIMVVTGAVTAIRLRTSPALPVYLWSFFPALAAVITVVGGQQLVHDSGVVGLFLLWGGVAGLAAYTLLTYRGIRKH